MHSKQITILVAAVMAALWLSLPLQATEGKRKTRHALVATYDDDVPMPDELMPVLTPQVPLADDNVPSHQHEYTVGRSDVKGIDVSHYQGRIDWPVVARSGQVSYVYVKATEGAQLTDNTFRVNLMGARAAGLKVGVYHFYSPKVDVNLQFQNFASQVSLKDMDLVPIIDVEHRGRHTLPEFQRRLAQFLQMVERHYRVQPIIYTSRDFYNKYLSGVFTNYGYMIARYHDDVPELVDDATFLMWQYTATGRVPGIRGNVDCSCFMGQYNLQDILIRH